MEQICFASLWGVFAVPLSPLGWTDRLCNLFAGRLRRSSLLIHRKMILRRAAPTIERNSSEISLSCCEMTDSVVVKSCFCFQLSQLAGAPAATLTRWFLGGCLKLLYVTGKHCQRPFQQINKHLFCNANLSSSLNTNVSIFAKVLSSSSAHNYFLSSVSFVAFSIVKSSCSDSSQKTL